MFRSLLIFGDKLFTEILQCEIVSLKYTRLKFLHNKCAVSNFDKWVDIFWMDEDYLIEFSVKRPNIY